MLMHEGFHLSCLRWETFQEHTQASFPPPLRGNILHV